MTPSTDAPDTEAAFRQAIAQVVRSVESLYRAADRQCCRNPAVAAHLRELADAVAGVALDSLRSWPTLGTAQSGQLHAQET